MEAKRINAKLDELYSKYKDRMDFYAKESLIAKTKGVSDEDLYAFGMMLENTDTYINYMKEASASDLGVLPQVALR